MSERIVYVIQEIPGTRAGNPKINIMGASQYGKFKFLLPELSQIIFSPGPLIYKLRNGLKDFNSEDYLLNEINKSEGFQPTTGYVPNMYRLEPRKCIMKMLNKCIDSGHSSHTQNNIIATELLNAGWKQDDIAFIFKCIYTYTTRRFTNKLYILL